MLTSQSIWKERSSMKRILVCAAAVVAAALAVLPAAGGAHSLATRSCGQVGFTPNSDDVASSIRATGLTCELARDFIRDSKGRPGARFRGFACAGTFVDAALPYRRYRCSGAGDVIRWQRF